jgi:hypothetical protein
MVPLSTQRAQSGAQGAQRNSFVAAWPYLLTGFGPVNLSGPSLYYTNTINLWPTEMKNNAFVDILGICMIALGGRDTGRGVRPGLVSPIMDNFTL